MPTAPGSVHNPGIKAPITIFEKAEYGIGWFGIANQHTMINLSLSVRKQDPDACFNVTNAMLL